MMFLVVVHGEGVKGGWYWPAFVEAATEEDCREQMVRRMKLLSAGGDIRGSGTIGVVMPVPEVATGWAEAPVAAPVPELG